MSAPQAPQAHPKASLEPASDELGIPFMRNFRPRDFGAAAQNWAVIQDTRGVIYVANNDGILEFDGVRWRLIPTAQKTIVRSLAMGSDGRIYVGAVGEIGYLAPDAKGQLAFVSLNASINKQDQSFADVWKTYVTSEGVYFSTLSQLMLYTPQGIKTWKPSTSFHLSFVVQDRLYIREVGQGLMEMREGSLRLIPGGERFAQERIYTMVPWGEAAASTPGKDPRILIGTRSQGFFIFDGTALTPFPTELDEFLKRTLLYHGALLPDGTLALATTGGGLAILGKTGQCVKILDKKLGLQDDVVRFIDVDRQWGIWLGLDNGLSRVEWPSPLSHFDDRNGLDGYSMDIRRHNGRLHVGTAQGTFVLNPAAHASSLTGARFSAIEGIKEQCWQILPAEDVALVANLQGVFEIRGTMAGLVLPVSAKSLSRSKRDPSRIFIGLREGLTSMYRHGKGQPWTDEGKIPGISENAHTMLEAEEGVLWLGTQSQGVLRITFPKDWQGSAASRQTPSVERFGLEQGLPSLNFNYVFQVGGKPVFATKKGVYSFQEESHRFIPDPRFDHLFPEAPRWILTIREDSLGRVWMHAQDEVNNTRETGFALRQPDGNYRWEATPLRRLSESTIEYIFPDDRGVVWLGGSDGLFRYDPRVPKDPTQRYKVLLRRVTQKGNQLLFSGARGGAMPEPALKFRENALRFEFAAPSFDLESANRYQVLLEGFDSAWSPWSAEPFKEYTNLHEGTYRFRVRAMNIYRQVSQEDMYPFRVLPPWYRTGWAFLLYLGLGAFTLWAVSRARTRILVARNRILRAQIGEATLGLQAQAEDLERMNGELRLLNEQKNQFFGIATHDLRNPLNGIVIEAQLIDGEEDLQVIYQAAQNIHREGLEMSALIERFLNIAAIESGGIKTEKVRFDLWKVAEHLVNRHSAWAREKGIGIRMEPLEGHGTVFADLKFTKEVLDNLISNSIKFSPPGKAVSVHVEGDGKKVLVSVRDQGPGLTEEDKARLFGRFAKLSARPTGGEKSTGLGLSIVKHMVEAMEGRIWVDSEPGRGATFQVELPAAIASLPEDAQAPTLPQEAASVPAMEIPRHPSPARVAMGSAPVRIFLGRVLLADDNANNRKVEEALLRRLGIEVVGVGDGLEALEALEREPFDIVFLDGRMPRLDGLGTVSEIRRRESIGGFFGGRHQIVVALTALADSMEREDFLAAGFDALLTKPLEMAALQEVLDQFLDPGTEAGARMKPDQSDSWEALATVLGGSQAFSEFLAEILDDADARLARLQSAIERMDRSQIEREAHDLKSNAATLGQQALAKVCSELEHGALVLNPEDLRLRLSRLPDLIEALRSKCRDYLHS